MTEDLVLAVSELAANSVLHGGGRGILRTWEDGDVLICEVSDSGLIANPLVGRSLPTPDQIGRRGVWLANQLCNLVQVPTRPAAAPYGYTRTPARESRTP